MYQIYITEYFKKQLKHLIKKQRQILNDVVFALENFDKNKSASLGAKIFKLRLRSTSLKKGKSNSYRLIILLIETNNLITPLTIYFKGDKSNISKKEILTHVYIISREIEKIK